MSNTSRIVPTLVALSLLLAPPAFAGKPGSTPAVVTNPLAERPGVKILTQREGWYSVRRQDLATAGWDPGSAPANLQLWAEGVQQSIRVNTGTDASLDPGDTIEFFGTGLDTPSTASRVYWLVQGSSAGMRVPATAAPRGKTAPRSFDDTVSLEPKTYYAPGVPSGSPDGFYGPAVNGTGLTQTIDAVDLDTSSTGTGSIEVTLQGAPSSWSHHVAVQVNGNAAGTIPFLYQASQTSSFAIPASWLVNGPNAVTLTALDGDRDVSLVVSLRLTYPRLYRAVAGSLECTAPGGSTVTIAGFPSASIQAFDITTPTTPAPLAVTAASSGGSYSATLSTSGSSRSVVRLLTFASGALSPAAIVPNATSVLAQATNQADFVIIAGATLLPSADALVSLRRSQGMQVSAVDVADVYDTFSYGEKDPAAIRRFLQYTTTAWAKAPRYVLLLGGASLDPRDYLGYGDRDLVPTRFVATAMLRTASDDWFVDFNDDGLPEMAIGRIPARDAGEASAVIAKIAGYGQDTGAWTSRVLMVSDANDQFLDFESASSSVAALVPASLTSQNVLAGQVGFGAAATAIANGFDSGSLVVNYTGHGLANAWSFSHIFSLDSVPALTNATQLPMVVSMACLNGYFQDPTAPSLAWATLLAPNGGAVAFWASSGMTNMDGETAMDQQLFRVLLDGSRPAIGDAVARAKAATTDPDVRKTWILFGDPTMKLAR